MRQPLTDEDYNRIDREVQALAEEAKRQYPKRKNESQSHYRHRIDGIVARWIGEDHNPLSSKEIGQMSE